MDLVAGPGYAPPGGSGEAPVRRPAAGRSDGVTCVTPWTTMMFLDPSGEATQCCSDWTIGSRGSAAHKTLGGVWNGEGYRHARRLMKRGPMSQLCRSICPRLYDGWEAETRLELLPGSPAFVHNQELLFEDLAEGREEVRCRPLTLGLASSTYCNYDCIMCTHGRTPRRDLPDSIWDEVPEFMPTLRTLVLIGGEPLADHRVMRFLMSFDAARWPDAGISMTTNGSLLTEAVLRRLERCTFADLTVSVNAGTAETYERVQRGIPFDALLSNVGAIARYRAGRPRPFQFRLGFVVQPANSGTLVEFGAVALQHGAGIRLLGLLTEQVPELDFYADGDAVAQVLVDLDRFADWARTRAPSFLDEIRATRTAIAARAVERSGGAGAERLPVVPRPSPAPPPAPAPALGAREIVRRLIGEGSVAGWHIRDVRASTGVRITFVSGDERERTVILRTQGQPGFYSDRRFSAMQLGRSEPGDRPLLDALSRLFAERASAFPAGDLEAGIDAAMHGLAPVAATEFHERALSHGHAELRLNLVCNEACFFCNCDSFAPNIAGDPVAAIAAVRRFAAEGVTALTLTGGEPTMHHALADVARAARAAGIATICVQTNAILLADSDLAVRLREAGVTELFVSLHSTRAGVSDKITCTPGGHERTLRGIDAALDAGLDVTVNFVINRVNMTEPLSYVRWLRDRFGGRIRGRVFSFMAPVAASLQNLALLPRVSEVLPSLRAALDDCLAAGERVKIAGVCGMPLCVLSGYERLADEFDNPSGVPLAKDRTKLPACVSCTHESRCSGIWTRYVELYGGAEFVPISPRPCGVAL